MKKVTITLYTFNELNEQAQKKAIEKLSDINVSFDWWESTYDDAKNIGLKLTGFDLDRNKHAKGDFIDSAELCAEEIMEEHGDESDTYKLASTFLADLNFLNIDLEKAEQEKGNSDECYTIQGKIDDLKAQFLSDLLEEYATMLQKESEYLQSEQAIKETIEANDYTFEEDGTMNNTPPDNEQESEQEVEIFNSQKELTLKLYNVLNNLLGSHPNLNGKLDYSDKDFQYIGDTLDIIKIKYIGGEPNGDREEELANNGEPMLTDEQAYLEVVTRFNNLTF
jgi:hypothetical protein